MKRKCLIGLVAAVLMTVMLWSLSVSAQAPNLRVNGETIYCKTPPIIVNGRTLVPTDVLIPVLDFAIRTKSATGQITVMYAGNSVEMTVGSLQAKVNGTPQTMEAAPQVIGKVKMLPLRFLAENLGVAIDWEAATNTVVMTSKNPADTTVVTPPESVSEKTASATVKADPAPTPTQPAATSTVDSWEVNAPQKVPSESKTATVSEVRLKNDSQAVNTITLSVSKPITPKVEQMSEPNRLVFDFADTQFKTSGNWEKSLTLASKVRYANHDGTTARLVIEASILPQTVCWYNNGSFTIRLIDNSRDMTFTDGTLWFPEGSAVKVKSCDAKKAVLTVSPAISSGTLSIDALGITSVSVKNGSGQSEITVQFSYPQNVTVNAGSVSFECAAFQTLRTQYKGKVGGKTVMLDAGHGGAEAGAVGKLEDGTILVREEVANLDITLAVEKLLKDCGVPVIMTRRDNTTVDLYYRAAYANQQDVDYFVSIHNNALANNTETTGSMIMYMTGSPRGARLAKNLLDCVVAQTGNKNLGLRAGDNLVVVHRTDMPAALVEGAFLTTPSDRDKLADRAYLDCLAAGIAEGILKTIVEGV